MFPRSWEPSGTLEHDGLVTALCRGPFSACNKGNRRRLHAATPDPDKMKSIFKSFCHSVVNKGQQIVHMLLGDKFKVRNQCYVSDMYLQQEILTNVTWCLLVTVVDTRPVILEVSH